MSGLHPSWEPECHGGDTAEPPRVQLTRSACESPGVTFGERQELGTYLIIFKLRLRGNQGWGRGAAKVWKRNKDSVQRSGDSLDFLPCHLPLRYQIPLGAEVSGQTSAGGERRSARRRGGALRRGHPRSADTGPFKKSC